MDAMGASRDAAQSAPPESLIKGIDHLVAAVDNAQAIEDGYERLKKAPKVDSTYCGTCEKNVTTSDTTQHTIKKK